MNLKKAEPPKSVERGLTVDFTRDEIIGVLTSYIKAKAQTHPVRIENIEVHCGDEGKLTKIELSGVEVIPLNWQRNEQKQETEEAEKTEGSSE